MDIRELFIPCTSIKTDVEGNKIISEINNLLATKEPMALRLIWQLVKDIDDWVRERKE